MFNKNTDSEINIKHVDYWIFDLDNTLYPHDVNLFSQVDHKMGLYIQEKFNVSYEEAKKQQKHYFINHGTTLRGLMSEHSIDPMGYLDFVHDIDFSVLNADLDMKKSIEKLPGEKFIYTNASTSYAKNVLENIGLSDCFKDYFDIHDANFLPKPDMRSYHKMIEKFDIEPTKSVMFEDIAANLNPAAELGMRTVWVRTNSHWSETGFDDENIDQITASLPTWLNNFTRNL